MTGTWQVASVEDSPTVWQTLPYKRMREIAAKYFGAPDSFLHEVQRQPHGQREFWYGWRGFRFIPEE